ncbi:reverse transcriptase domain-containing protein [Tanacetum coccineum]
MACEEYSQEVLGFSDVIASGNPTPYYDPIISTSSSTLTPFGDSDFLLEEVDAFLALKADPTSPEVDDFYYDPKGDILLLESFLNDDPSLPPPTQGLSLDQAGLKVPPPPSSLLKVVERETEVTKDTVPPTNNGSTEDVQPPVVQVETHVPIFEPVVAPVSAPKPNPKPSIPYPSRLNDQKIREKANNQIEKFYQIFQDLHFDISFADALILMPKFASTLKSLISNKEKLFELARTPLNEHCSAVLLKKLLEKLGDPGKFLIPCDFLGMDECLALADLGASINLMPLSVWKKLSLPELTPTCMTLELADRSISRPIGIAKDVYIKSRKVLIPGRLCSRRL